MRRTLLLVDGDAAARAAQHPGFETVAAGGCAEALALLGTRHVDVLVTQMRLPDGTALDLVRDAAPRPPCIVLARYEELPEIVPARARGLVSKVLPSSARPEKIAAAAERALDGDEVSQSRSGLHGGLDALEELLRWTAARLAQIPGVVVRPLPPDKRALQLQFVVRGGKRLDALRKDIVGKWLWPLKPKDAAPAKKDRGHPVLRHFGGFTESSELYAREHGDLHAYFAVLPWQHEGNATCALGVVAPAFRDDAWQLLRDLHAESVDALHEFALPVDEESSGIGQAIPEYDWIVTPDYVGPDRRTRPTSFLNRFLFFGRRKRVPSRVARATESFRDVPHPRVLRYAAAYLVLALVDTVLTWVCVRAGLVREANPLLRPLIFDHPWAFLALKNAVAVLAFAAVARFELFRYGIWALRAAVAAYFLLDVYWLVLLRTLDAARASG